MRPLLPVFALAVLTSATGPALAGPVADFESELRAVYGTYRVALFATNTGNAAKSTEFIAAFEAGWADLAKGFTTAPQYADDPAVPATVTAVSEDAAKAAEAAKAGNLTEAHEALEGIRGEIGALHRRNGMWGFSDSMNAYHAMMEAVLATDPAKLDGPGMERLAEQIGVLGFWAADIADHPAPEASDPAYPPLAQTFQASVDAMVKAVRAGDPEAIKSALAALKPAYSKFFLKFG